MNIFEYCHPDNNYNNDTFGSFLSKNRIFCSVNLHFMKVSTEIDNNFGYEKISQLVDNIPLNSYHIFICSMLQSTDYFNTSHSINTVEETAYMYICNTICSTAG